MSGTNCRGDKVLSLHYSDNQPSAAAELLNLSGYSLACGQRAQAGVEGSPFVSVLFAGWGLKIPISSGHTSISDTKTPGAIIGIGLLRSSASQQHLSFVLLFCTVCSR